MLDWDDLKYLLAVARHHSTLAAGRALGVDQSTVQRRLKELERQLGRQLVERYPTGYQLTELGQELLPHAERMEQAAQALQQQVEGNRRDLVGLIRVTCPEPLVYRLTRSGLLDRFHARHPGLRVEFVMSDRVLDLQKGEADVALRSGDAEDSDLVGRKVADSLWAVYGSRGYLERAGRPGSVAELARHALVGLDESMAGHRAAAWLRQVAPGTPPVARADGVLGLVSAARSGVGLAPLPTALGDAEPDLVRVLGPIEELTRAWRLLTTPELRRTPRVAAFFDFVVEELDALRPILSG
ncbi:MAG: LysR family transcriptional regulator [Deltaproteobacteria bacterium]|nr:LysR family transcriptional regulator [Deltaproteobacteria bacterium]